MAMPEACARPLPPRLRPEMLPSIRKSSVKRMLFESCSNNLEGQSVPVSTLSPLSPPVPVGVYWWRVWQTGNVIDFRIKQAWL